MWCVRFGSLADILRCGSDIRFTPESGHSQLRSECLLSAKSEMADHSITSAAHASSDDGRGAGRVPLCARMCEQRVILRIVPGTQGCLTFQSTLYL